MNQIAVIKKLHAEIGRLENKIEQCSQRLPDDEDDDQLSESIMRHDVDIDRQLVEYLKSFLEE